MRIAINTRFLRKNQLEGVGRFIYETCRRLVRDHPEDEFFFFFDRKPHPDFVFGPNVTTCVLFPPAKRPILWYWWFEHAVYRALRKHRIDAFFSPDTYLSLRSSVPTLLACHDIAYAHYPEHIPQHALRYYRKYFPKFHRKADHIVAVSEYTRNDIIRVYGLDPIDVTVAYNACSARFQALSDPEKQEQRQRYAQGRPYFIYVGSLHPRKNVEGLLQAFDHFKTNTEHAHQLLLVGRRAWKSSTIFEVHERMTHRDAVHFLDHVEDGVEKLMAGSDALVYASWHEGFGIPILEAMHCDVPVITSNRSSMPEVAGDAALIVDPARPIEIARAMQRIVEEPGLAKQLVEKGRKQRRVFDWDRTTRAIYDRLKAITSARKAE